jgi:hypothetical protein
MPRISPILRPALALFAASLLLPLRAQAGAALTATVGASSRDHFKGARFAYSGGAYMKWDEMVLLGVQGGMGSIAGPASVPLLGSAIMRLPFGRAVMPYAAGDVGYVLDDVNDGLLWRGGGGFDIKNGRHSSLLLQGGYEAASGMAGWYGRGGLLLEF